MRIWLLKDGELLPTDAEDVRLLRVGLLADELTNRGHQVTWWTSSFNHFKKEFVSTCNKDVRVKSNYLVKLLHSSGYQKNISLKRIFHNRDIARKFLLMASDEKKPDIILAALPTVEFALAATQYGRQHNVPVILDLRDMWPDIMVEAMPTALRPLARLMLGWQFSAMKRACHDATGLVGITKSFLQWGLSYASRKQNDFDDVYPLACSDSQPDATMLEEAKIFWEQFGLVVDHNDFVITYIGSLNLSYQIDLLIEVVKSIGQSVKLVICGDGPSLNSYKKQAYGYTNIIFVGRINRSKMWYLLRLSSVGVSPHNVRCDSKLLLTNKIAEYLSAGLPVVTNLPPDGETGKLLLDNKCGFCFSENGAENLAKILMDIKCDSELLRQMSKNARAVYESKLIMEKVYADMCSYLERIVNSHNVTDINKVRSFYDNQVQRTNLSDEVCGSDYLPVYLRSPYLFVYSYLRNKIKSHHGGLRLLDLCCGTGVHAVRFAQLGFTVTGIDVSSISIDSARNLAKKFNVVEQTNFAVGEVGQKIDFLNESFDVVFISGSLYYLNYEKIFPEISKVLKKGGVFVCIETNGDNFIMNFIRKIKNIFLHHRDEQTISGLLKSKDIDRILQLLPSSKEKYFDFFTLASCFFIWNNWFLMKWLKPAIFLDNYLLNKFGLRILSFKFVIISEK